MEKDSWLLLIYRFAIDITDVKIQEGLLFVSAVTTFQQWYVVIYIFGNVTKYFECILRISSNFLQLHYNNFAIA